VFRKFEDNLDSMHVRHPVIILCSIVRLQVPQDGYIGGVSGRHKFLGGFVSSMTLIIDLDTYFYILNRLYKLGTTKDEQLQFS